ncbi:amidase [Sabulicella glaciei]|uniref:Amidase n=1 Tax=Sabulicella glaciei TaxID=2984948 RepID=A0ABT3NWK2_9PROT|nr:amidase [Roseococcus sp. MDT2-1-1]MCW8086518.1 amidase [Roseococcus sp. MDT2-1-1]
MPPEDTVQAFIPGPRAVLGPAGLGVLNGLDFAAKDLFDIAGWPTSGGNPDWERTHPGAVATAPVVMALLEAGARLAGKTRTVELAYGLTGENVWHGTPLNPAAPGRFPGGSSCGSASAVAGGLVDFALGTDTAGSVRIPASYCGVFGIRPSWGAVSLAGTMALAPSFDTCGWFARSASVLRRVGEALLPEDAPSTPRRLGPAIKVQSAWMNAEPATAAALTPALEAVERVLGLGEAIRAETGPNGLRRAFEAARTVQAQEAWVTHGAWIEETQPRFGPGVAERFAAAKATDPEKAAAGRLHRRRFAASMRALLQGGAVLAFPTSPGPAPLLGVTLAQQDAVRERTMGVTAYAGLAGLCEVTLPAAQVEGAPVGLSLAAAPGHDRALLELAERLAAELGIGE